MNHPQKHTRQAFHLFLQGSETGLKTHNKTNFYTYFITFGQPLGPFHNP